MSSTNEDVIQQLLGELTGALQSKLPLEHFCQFYDEPHFDNLAQQEARRVLGNFQLNSKLSTDVTFAVFNQLFPKLQDVIKAWKAKNVKNRTQCDQFLQSQVDFLVTDFKTSVMIKLVSAPDIGFEDLESILDLRKMVLIDIFEKLSKPGEPQSSVDMKTSLNVKLDSVKIETLEKQRLHLERMSTDKATKVLEDTKGIIMEKARQLKSDLTAYQGNDPKDLVKEKLGEIDYFLRLRGKELDEHYPSIYSAVLRTTAEVRKCLDEEDYKDMGAEEFAETLHEQLLNDFVRENHAGIKCEMDLDSSPSGPSDERSSKTSGDEDESLQVRESNENEIWQCRGNELRIDFAEEGMKQEKEDERDLDHNLIELGSRDINAEVVLIPSGEAEIGDLEGEEENQIEEINESSEDNLESGFENPKKSKKHVSKTTQNSSRRSARLQMSSAPAAMKRSKRKGECVSGTAKETRYNDDDDEPSSSRYDSDDGKMDLFPKAGSSKLSGRKPSRPKKHPLNDDKTKRNADKITYLHLKGGRPVYRCRKCNRKCSQNMLQYHGEHCGKKDLPFTCNECGTGFLHKSSLQYHARIHTGERPCECPKCSERFAHPSNLKRHMQLHNGNRRARFACEICKLSFVSRVRFHEHNMSMHKEKLGFGCRYCDNRFDAMKKLKVHVIAHSGIRPFRCPSCDTSTATKYNLAVHIQKGHSQPWLNAQRLADEAAIAFLVEETSNESYRHLPKDRINSLVVSHIMKKANLKLPRNANRRRKSTVDT